MSDRFKFRVWDKQNECYVYSKIIKELLYSLKCCLSSQNIESQIRIEKSLTKITNAIGEK